MTLEGVLQTKAFVLERTSGADGLERMGITRCACTIRSLMKAVQLAHVAELQQTMTLVLLYCIVLSANNINTSAVVLATQ